MNRKRLTFLIISGLLVLIALTGMLEEMAYNYIQQVSEKNIGFLGFITELRFILSGISDLIPFLKGHSGALNESLGKAENYLLITNGISLMELMLLGITKSWLIKGVILVLFALSVFGKPGSLSFKLLILALTLNPGLQLFSVTMSQLSASASIDYGQAYYTQLQQSVDELKKEKSQLSQQHARNLTEINNGDKKGLVFFKKLKEDISYDVKKAKTSIKGEFTHLRMLIHDGGRELIRKITIFCSMVLFSLLLMPLGYALLAYTVYKSVITPKFEQQMHAAGKEIGN